MIGSWMGPRDGLDDVEKKIFSLTGTRTATLLLYIPQPVAIPTALPRLLNYTCMSFKLKLCYWLTISMEISPSWKAASCTATQEFRNILRNSKVHYRVHKIPPPVSIPSQISLVRTPQHISQRSNLILSTRLYLGLPSGLSPSGFPTKNLYSFPFPHLCYMPCQSQIIQIRIMGNSQLKIKSKMSLNITVALIPQATLKCYNRFVK
jgi:hypothetical protein